jgi:phosphatidylserine/phosphatidylglycerophosphate/cardiolipin synthase-like enzyme
MRTISQNDKIYIGRKAGIEILKEVLNSKESVKIVSPYLSSSYLEKLVNLQKKGVKITLITCDEIKESEKGFSNFKLSDIIKQKEISLKDIKTIPKHSKPAFLGMLILSAILFLLTPFLPLLLIISLPLLIISLIGILFPSLNQKEYEYYSVFRLKIFDSHSSNKPWSTNLIHSKIFIIDENIAFLGSANFTYSGFNTHYETIIKIEDKNAISIISQEIESLYNSTELKSKTIRELGEKIYN